jgi:hypothetical protein
MKWLSLIPAVTILLLSPAASAQRLGLFRFAQEDTSVAPEAELAPLPDTPSELEIEGSPMGTGTYSDFPAYPPGYSSYKGLGYQGSGCHNINHHAIGIWSGYCGHGGCHHGFGGCHHGLFRKHLWGHHGCGHFGHHGCHVTKGCHVPKCGHLLKCFHLLKGCHGHCGHHGCGLFHWLHCRHHKPWHGSAHGVYGGAPMDYYGDEGYYGTPDSVMPEGNGSDAVTPMTPEPPAPIDPALDLPNDSPALPPEPGDRAAWHDRFQWLPSF